MRTTFLKLNCDDSVALFQNLWNILSKMKMIFRRISLCIGKRLIYTRAKLTQKESEPIHWWDSHYLLSRFNTLRVPFIVNGIYASGIKNMSGTTDKTCLNGVKILEVGCGGGILCEDLARLRADVIGLDIDAEVIETAKEHQATDESIKHNLRYLNTSIDEHEKSNREKYDVVVISEVIEHVPNEQKENFLTSSINTLQPGGSLFITCPSRTIIGRIVVVFLAELFNIIPKGTHDYNEFISPEDLTKMIEKRKCVVKKVEGIFYNPFKKDFVISSNKSLFYGIHALKIK